MNIQIDDLGRETQFVVCDTQIAPAIRQAFEALLTRAALGYTKIEAWGGWRGNEEPITIYKVASLNPLDRDYAIQYLLINTAMTDLYVVYPDGQAKGHCKLPDGGPTVCDPFPQKA